jgi:hypothetical protein
MLRAARLVGNLMSLLTSDAGHMGQVFHAVNTTGIDVSLNCQKPLRLGPDQSQPGYKMGIAAVTPV